MAYRRWHCLPSKAFDKRKHRKDRTCIHQSADVPDSVMMILVAYGVCILIIFPMYTRGAVTDGL